MNKIIKNLLKVTVVTLCFVCVSCWTVSAQQKKAPTIDEITLKAVEAKVITSAERTKIVELTTKAQKDKAELKKKNLSADKLEAESKKIDDKRTADMKALLGDTKLKAWNKFRTDYVNSKK